MNPLVLPTLIDLGKSLIDRLLPDPAQKAEAQLKLLAMAQTGELAQLEAVKAINVAQIDVNKADASGQSPMQRNWRPMIGWVCGFALAWDTILKPMAVTAWIMTGHPAPVLPQLSTDQLYGLLFGILGLGGLRTYEKVKA